MASDGKRVQLIPTSLDKERIAQSLKERVPDRVYILYNKDPLETHEDLNKDVRELTRNVVEENTMCYERGEVEEEGIDFYRFNEALVDIYSLMYEESKQGNEVLANVSGGTKPVAIGLSYASSLVDGVIPIFYYVAENYTDEDSQSDASSTGIVGNPFQVSPLQAIDLTDVIPQDKEKEVLLLELLKHDDYIGIKELLVNREKISKSPPNEPEKKKERKNTLQRYHRHAGSLLEDNIVEKSNSKYKLTKSGDLISRLLRERIKVEEKLRD